MSPYNAFDNNPVFWADPSGADGENSVGADGLTNDQWRELSKPGGGGFHAMMAQARDNFFTSNDNEIGFTKEKNKNKATIITGDVELESVDGDCCGGSGAGIQLSNGGILVIGANGVEVIDEDMGNTFEPENSSVSLSWKSVTGISFLALAAPFPKAFIAKNASTHSSVFSTIMSKTSLVNKKINWKGKRRLYTHTVNGSKRYAANWGRYIGRWGTRIAGPVGIALTMYDVLELYYKTQQKVIREQYNGDSEAFAKDIRRVLKSSHQVCFVKETKISMADGSLRNIEDIVVGDYIYTYNEQTKKIESNQVLSIDSPIHEKFAKIIFDNGIINKNTLDHPYFVVNKGWCSLSTIATKLKYNLSVGILKENDICYYLDKGKLIKVSIKKIDFFEKKQKTYNLSNVENNHNFFANGILVHNKRGR